jgi:hypothetical protein
MTKAWNLFRAFFASSLFGLLRSFVLENEQPCARGCGRSGPWESARRTEADRGMSKPTPIVFISIGIGLGLFGLRMFGIEAFQYKWVLAFSLCLIAYSTYLYVIEKRPKSN